MSHIATQAIDRIETMFVKKTLNALSSKAKFLSTLRIYNHKTNERYSISFNPEWEIKYREMYYISKFNYIHLKAIENNMQPIFITLTLPSKYHQFKKDKKGEFVFNKKYEDYSITEGYQRLNKAFRHLYNNFKYRDNNKMVHIKTKFIKVIEPHKTFTPHLHAIVYIPQEYTKRFKKHFNNTINMFEMKQTDYEELGYSNKDKSDTLKNKAGSINYLLKYVSKTIGGNAILSGWKTTHNIRVVTTSNIAYSKKHYDLFVKKVGWDKTTSNIFIQMENELTVKSYYMVVDKSYIGTFTSRKQLLEKLIKDNRFNKYKEIKSKEDKYIYIDYRILSVKPKNEFLVTFEDEKIYQYETRYKYDDMFLRHDLTYDTIGEYDKELGIFVPSNVQNEVYWCYDTEFGDDETIEQIGKSKEKVYSEIVLYQTLSKNIGNGIKIYDKSDFSVFIN